MRKAAILFIGTIAAVAWAAQAPAQTADEIIEKALAALGGRAALSKLQTRVATGTISVTTQGMTFSGPIEIYNKAPNKSRMYFRLDMSTAGIGEMVVDQRCDGKTAFVSNNVQGDRELAGEELQAMLNGAVFPSALLGYKQAGAKAELVGKDKIDTRDVYVVLYTPKAGPAVRLFFDAGSYLALRTVSTITAPELGGATERINDVTDYRDVDGVKVPFGMKIVTGPQTVEIAFTKIEHNKPLEDAMFAKPVK